MSKDYRPPTIPLRLSLPLLIGLVIGSIHNRRAWTKAEASLDEAARLWGERLLEQDKREDKMLALASRQVRLGWISLVVAVISMIVAVVAIATA